MRFEAPTLELFEHGECVAWHPVLPARDLPAYRGRSVAVTREYLENAVSETKRYYSDLAQAGSDYRRPILVAHDDGRRLGDLVDFDVREFRDTPTLFVKSQWLPKHWAAVMGGEYERGSIRIVPSHTDPQTGNTYGPFIDEFSVTEKPVIKDYRLTDTVTPEALAAVGLTLSHTTGDEMTIAEMRAALEQLRNEVSELQLAEEPAPAEGGASSLSQLLDQLLAMMAQLTAEVQELKGIKSEDEAADASEEDVAASEDEAGANNDDDDDVIVQLSELRNELERMKRASKRNTRERGAPGELELGDRKLSTKQAVEKAKSEGLSGIAAVRRAKELRGES